MVACAELQGVQKERSGRYSRKRYVWSNNYCPKIMMALYHKYSSDASKLQGLIKQL